MIPANRQRNYLQSALYVVIAGVLATVLLERLLTYAEAVEKALMEATLSRLHTGLYARVALLALRGEYEALEGLQAQSPFVAAEVSSADYLGELAEIPADGAADGEWFFDRQRRELVYVPNLKRYLFPPPGEASARALRFRVEVRKPSQARDLGVVITPLGGTRWDPLP